MLNYQTRQNQSFLFSITWTVVDCCCYLRLGQACWRIVISDHHHHHADISYIQKAPGCISPGLRWSADDHHHDHDHDHHDHQVSHLGCAGLLKLVGMLSGLGGLFEGLGIRRNIIPTSSNFRCHYCKIITGIPSSKSL